MFKSSMIGNLVADPVVRYTASGKAVADIRLACDCGKDKASYVDVVFWEKDAELAAQHLIKGRKIYVDCRVHQDEWKDEASGKNRSKHVHTCINFEFLSNGAKKEDSKDG